jgi:thiamine kinase-like enzyme
LQRLHRSGLRFRGYQNPGELIMRYFDLLDPRMRAKFSPRVTQAHRTVSLLQNEAMDWVPSHCDPVLENLLLASRRLWLIDWEYSAMASPYWDLALLCNEAGFDLAQSRRLLQAYSAGGAPLQESVLFDYRGLLKLLSDCWMAALA